MTVVHTSPTALSYSPYPNQFLKRSNPISWNHLYEARRSVARRFGAIWRLPVQRRWSDVLAEHLDTAMSVLEIGAGRRRTLDYLARLGRDVRYRSMDVDRSLPHDYYSLEDVDETFDAVLAFEVIEHLELEEARGWLQRIFALVRPGGLLLLTTPNTFYPPAFLRDATHRTPFCYDELGAVVTLAGFHVERLLRLYHDPVWRKFVRRVLLGWLYRLIGIDYARQIMLVARKPVAQPSSAPAAHSGTLNGK